jgi:transcriptional regulator with XRE-family HTH domain
MRRAIRENAGVPLRRVAEDIGVTAQAVALWEAGQRAPRAQYLVRYVALLDALREVAR